MKTQTVIIALAAVLLAGCDGSQSIDKSQNRTDEYGRKQGHWVEEYMDYADPSNPHEHRGEGSYVDGKRQGHWVEHHTDGSAVGEGPYVDGKKHGRWVERFADGSVQEGRYVDDKMHGQWVFRAADGDVLEGRMVDGEAHGHWVLRDANGDMFEICYEYGILIDC